MAARHAQPAPKVQRLPRFFNDIENNQSKLEAELRRRRKCDDCTTELEFELLLEENESHVRLRSPYSTTAAARFPSEAPKGKKMARLRAMQRAHPCTHPLFFQKMPNRMRDRTTKAISSCVLHVERYGHPWRHTPHLRRPGTKGQSG